MTLAATRRFRSGGPERNRYRDVPVAGALGPCCFGFEPRAGASHKPVVSRLSRLAGVFTPSKLRLIHRVHHLRRSRICGVRLPAE
jgi:hypothetical protein